MAKSNQEILEILKVLNSLPIEDIREEMDSLEMTFEDWRVFTNTEFDTYEFTEEQVRMAESQTNIPYSKFLDISRSYPLDGFSFQASGLSSAAKSQRESIEQVGGNVPIEVIEELPTLEKIETQWNDLRLKYDTVHEVARITENVRYMLMHDAILIENMPVIEEMKNSIEQLKKCFGYIEDTKRKDRATIILENDLISAVQGGTTAFESLLQVKDEPLSEFYKFFEENGVSQTDIEQYYKNKLANMKPDSKVFVMAREGECFRLNDSGEIEIFDERRAKELIVQDFFPTSVAKASIDKLGQGEKYVQTAESLPQKYLNLNRLTKEQIKELMEADPVDLKYWMVDHPNKINQALTALKLRGRYIDWTEIQNELIDELENPRGYFEDDAEEEYYKSKVKDALSAMGYDVTARSEDYQSMEPEEQEDYMQEDEEKMPEMDDLSSLTVEELNQIINSNNQTIENNDQTIKQALIQKILGQQQRIAEQKAEIDRLTGQKEL